MHGPSSRLLTDTDITDSDVERIITNGRNPEVLVIAAPAPAPAPAPECDAVDPADQYTEALPLALALPLTSAAANLSANDWEDRDVSDAPPAALTNLSQSVSQKDSQKVSQ